MKIKQVDDEEVLDGQQTFRVYIESGFGTMQEYITFADGVSKDRATLEIEQLLDAIRSTAVNEGWEPV